MSRYIDAENIGTLFDEEYKATLELIKQGETHLDSLAEGFTEAYDIIERIPTADVKPVVYCKDCEFWKIKNTLGTQGICMCGEKEYNYGGEFYPMPNDFCSYGVKANNE